MSSPTVSERAAEPFVAAFPRMTAHMSIDEVYEVCRSGGEQELNDLLRHAANRIVKRRGWIVEREKTGFGRSRVDIFMADRASRMPFAWIEAKMRYATDAVMSPTYVGMGKNGIGLDVEKFRRAPSEAPSFILVWAPYFEVVRLPLRYMRGHAKAADGWTAKLGLEECRDAMGRMLGDVGATTMTTVVSGEGVDGFLTLDAWLTEVA